MTEFYIDNEGIPLHVKAEYPQNKEKFPLVILIHGLTGDMEERHITAAAEAIKRIGFGVLRAELRGHGKSGGTFREHTIFKWISDIMKITEYAKSLEPVTDLYLCGHSQGGLTVMLAAGMRPDDYRAVIPLSPALVIPDGARKGNLLGITFDPDHIPDTLILKGRELSGNYFRTARMIHAEDAVRGYHGPVLIIHGDKDETVPVRYSREAAELYENCRLIILPGSNHTYDGHLSAVTEAVSSFLQELHLHERKREKEIIR